MRGTDASVLVLTGLAALAGAKELQIDDVPVECATICGPIVELTFKCDVDNSFDELRRLKRRKVDGPEAQRIPPHAKGGVARRHHHRNRPPAQNEADVAVATPTQPQDAAPSVGDAQGVQQPAQDAQPPAQEASPVFIATLPFAAPAPDPQLSTPNPPPEAAQTTPSVEVTPQVTPTPSSDPPQASSTSSSTPAAPPPPPPPPPMIPPPAPAPPPPPPKVTQPLIVPVFVQPTSTVFLTVPAPSLPPIPQVTIPAPLLPSIPPISIPPLVVAPPPQQPRPQQPPPVQQPPPAQAPQVPAPQQSTPSTSMSMPSAMPVAGEPGKKEPQPNPETDKDTAEKNCICGNKSFDVNLLAGMCQSCIKRSGNRANDMDFIMNQCNFTQATYTPDKDNLAYNVRVVAQKPLLSHSANAMGDAPRIGAASALAAIGVSFVAGMALLL
ncbi:hypothetical protein CGCA056_v005749 [Colletotrichum aenigma]|uniref:uncharacterized protein n=1 Tax=Colletotrichum aenigma TaxID=1215731 RepID=UPI0018728A98|nr:uncharacterized protein CGCA056_v005749 [Colletotrichum aenigma]KAF5524280.1 hypothetical protein CGCA056_v005749 [Colletotrichum aenigma]